MCSRYAHFAAGVDAADGLLKALGYQAVTKATSILTRQGYDRAVRAVLKLIQEVAAEHDQEAMREAARQLDRNWPKLSAGERDRVIAAASKTLLKVPAKVVKPIERATAKGLAAVVRETKETVVDVHKLKITPSFNAVDQRIVDFAARSQGNYITDQYGNRAYAFEQKARDIVAKGILAGEDADTIGKRLAAQVTGPGLRKAESYWTTVAGIHVARARSWGTLSSFDDAGIEAYVWESVLDEVTSDICRYMHGKRFETKRAVESFMKVEGGADVATTQPWVRTGQTSDGAQFLYVDRGGKRTKVADIDESGVGRKDDVGSFSKGLGPDRLQGLGVDSPPAHPNCRSTLVPE